MMYKIEEKPSFDEQTIRIRAVEFDHRHRNQRPPPPKTFSMLANSVLVRRILVMVLFAASLLGLPLVLPPLGPPPLIFLLVPVAIMAGLIFLAVMPPQQLPNDLINSI
ncbi:hypothetical protein CASFOL_019465 [Castilleja foliolosa]|uniref:Uncharacterized protein n=1 Tax=Castilleja foliolosa TaxID=1961234 RepID=A0ABD3D849_9LAMI